MNRYIYPEFKKQVRDLPVALSSDVMELVEGNRNAGTNFTAVIRPKRNAEDLKPVPIVKLKQFSRQISKRMIPKIARQICNPHLVVLTNFTFPNRLRRKRTFVFDVGLSAF